jgi:hypothetical protein
MLHVAPWWNEDTLVLGTSAFGHPSSTLGGATKFRGCEGNWHTLRTQNAQSVSSMLPSPPMRKRGRVVDGTVLLRQSTYGCREFESRRFRQVRRVPLRWAWQAVLKTVVCQRWHRSSTLPLSAMMCVSLWDGGHYPAVTREALMARWRFESFLTHHKNFLLQA